MPPPRHNSYFSIILKKYKGFTLAEVLITLGIIGIVASLTLPNIIVNYKKKQTVTQLKKVYSVLSQAYEMSKSENESSEYWIDNSVAVNTDAVKKYVQKYWLPYFKSIQECSKYGDCAYNVGATSLNGTDSLGLVGNNRYTIILGDGTLIAFVPFSWDDNLQIQYWGGDQKFYVDLNGAKKPNIIGKDVFIFKLSDNKLMANCQTLSKSQIDSNCSKTGNCMCCAGKIIRDNWEIKDDYPW